MLAKGQTNRPINIKRRAYPSKEISSTLTGEIGIGWVCVIKEGVQNHGMKVCWVRGNPDPKYRGAFIGSIPEKGIMGRAEEVSVKR